MAQALAISGTGVIVEMPCQAEAEGCVTLSFINNAWPDGEAKLSAHPVLTKAVCLVNTGGGRPILAYRQSRSQDSDPLLQLVKPGGYFSPSTTRDGAFSLSQIPAGCYTAPVSHPLYVKAMRAISISPGQIESSAVGLWAGHVNQEGRSSHDDWVIVTAAGGSVNDPPLALNGDGRTDVRESTIW